MLRAPGKTRWPWEILLILFPIIGLAWLVWAQPLDQGPGGPGGGDDPEWRRGGRPGGPSAPLLDPRQFITINGVIESLGNYGIANGRVTPGTAGQRLVLKTGKGKNEVDLGLPGYVAEKGLRVKVGDTLEVAGFQTYRGGRTVFIGVAVKTPQRELKLLDEWGFPLWQDGGPRGPGAQGTTGPRQNRPRQYGAWTPGAWQILTFSGKTLLTLESSRQ